MFSEENPARDFVEEKVCLYSVIYSPICFKLGYRIKTAKLFISMLVCMTLFFIQYNSCIRKQKLLCPLFFGNFAADLDEIQYVLIT